MKKNIHQVLISMVVKGGIINTLKKAGIQVLTEDDQMVAASNRDAVEKRGEKFAARLGNNRQGRADNAGRIIFDGGNLITPKDGVEFVSPSTAHDDLTKLGFVVFDYYLKMKKGDTSGKAWLCIKYRRAESFHKPHRDVFSVSMNQLTLISSIMEKTYVRLTAFHNQARTYEKPPRWYDSEPENITLNFVGFAITQADFAEKNQHKFRVARFSDGKEYFGWPLVGLPQIASI